MRVAGIPLGIGNVLIDPSLTLALYHFDGTNGTQVFTDSGQYGNNLIAESNNNGTYLSNAWYKFDGTSLYCDGASFVNYLTTPTSMVGQLGSSDFTIETWVKPSSIASQKGVFNIYADSSRCPINCKIVGGVLTAGAQMAGSQLWIEVTHQTSIVAGQEYHIAMQRIGNLLQVFLNGVKCTTDVDIGTGSLTANGTGFLQIGTGWNYVGDFPQPFNGHIDEFRIRKQAMYLADFTPPSSPFTG